MKASEYRQYVSNKYHAQKTELDGITFDSRKEANRYALLKQQERFGLISNLKRQVSFELQPGYTNNQGKKIRPITYVADFVYNESGEKVVEDVKGSKKTLTDSYKIKRKLFEYKYPEYIFVEFI